MIGFIYKHQIKSVFIYNQQLYLSNMLSKIITQIDITDHNHTHNFNQDKMAVYTDRQKLIWSILRHIKNRAPQQIIQKYSSNTSSKDEEKTVYFQILVELINYFEENSAESTMLKEVLQKLLQIQHNLNKYLNIVPKQVFLSIKKYNHKTFERKEKKMSNKMEYAHYSNYSFDQSTKGFAELTLNLCNYFADPNMEITATQYRLLQIVGKYQLDFTKVIQMVVDVLPSVLSQNKIMEIIKMINAPCLSYRLLNKMFPAGKQEAFIEYRGNISPLMQKTKRNILLDFNSQVDQRYFKIYKICIENGILKQQEFKDYLPAISQTLLMQRQTRIVATIYQRIQKLQNKVFGQVSLSQIEDQQKKKNQLLMGQVVGCCKFAKLQQKLKNNQFIQFQQLYTNLCDQKVTITLSVPLLKLFCQLIEWMINPLLQKYSIRKHFINRSPYNKFSFPQGYFYQTQDLTLECIIQLQEIFFYLDIYIGFSPVTFHKVVNIFTLFMKNKTGFDLQNHQEIKFRIKNIIKTYLLGAISLQNNNPTLLLRLSQNIQLFPQKERFELYEFYVRNVQFENLHLVYQLEYVSKFQNTFLNKMKFQTSFREMIPLRNLQLNFPFQSSFELSKRLTTSFFANFIPVITQIIFNSPFLSKDILVYFCVDTLIRNEQKLMGDYDKTTEYYKSVIFFLCQLYKKDEKIEMEVLFQLATVRLREYIEQPPASQINVPTYNRNLVFLKLIESMMQQICPVLTELISSTSDKYQYLLQGYYMKLYLSDKCLQYGKTTVLRQNFYKTLFKRQSNMQTYFVSLISLVNYHIRILSSYNKNHQQNATKTIQKHGKCIDECKSFLSHLITFFCLQINRKDLYTIQETSLPFNFEQITDLIVKQDLDMGFGCWLLRQINRYEFQQGRVFELKRKWIKMLNKKYESIENQQFQKIMFTKQKVLSFVKSDFFFNFWFSSTQHIVTYQDKYCHKITELRRKLQGKQVESLDKQKLVIACNLIQGQKQQFRKSYQAFNVLSFSMQNFELGQRNPRFEMPIEYNFVKQKIKVQLNRSNQDQLFKEFINLYFTYCLLPRILVDPCQAIFCSKFTFKFIKENKLPSNKSLMIIFTIIEAAVGYVQFSTQRQASKCLPVFINDLLKLLKNWHDAEQLQAILLTEIGMEKFTDKRYQILKEFILDFTTKVTSNLTIIKNQPFINRNLMLFLDKTDCIPLTQEQGQQIIVYIKELCSSNILLKTICQRIISILEKRIKNVASMKNVIINRQTKNQVEKARKAAETIPLPDNAKKMSSKDTNESKNQPKIQKKVIVIDLDDDEDVKNKPVPIKTQVKRQMRFYDEDD